MDKEVFGYLLGREISTESSKEDVMECLRVMIRQDESRRKLEKEHSEFKDLCNKARAGL